MHVRDLWPYRRLVLETVSPPDVAERLLRGVVDIDLAPTGRNEWIGSVSPGRFKITRRLRHTNSFAPLVEGCILAAPFGSRIAVTMRMQPFFIGFTIVWMSLIIMVCPYVSLRIYLQDGEALSLLGLTMPVMAVAIVAAGFAPEARRAECFLRAFFPPVPSHLAPFR